MAIRWKKFTVKSQEAVQAAESQRTVEVEKIVARELAAKERLVNSNLRLVMSIARRYQTFVDDFEIAKGYK